MKNLFFLFLLLLPYVCIADTASKNMNAEEEHKFMCQEALTRYPSKLYLGLSAFVQITESGCRLNFKDAQGKIVRFVDVNHSMVKPNVKPTP